MLVGIVLLLMLNLVAVGNGYWVVRAMLRRDAIDPEDLLASLGIGFGLIGYLALAIGLVGGLYRLVAWAVVILLLLPSSSGWVRIIGGPRPRGDKGSARQMDLVAWGMLFFIGAHAFLYLLGALAPPTEGDTIIYHLALPKSYVQAHRIYFDGSSYFGTMAYLMEALYTLGLLLGSDTFAALLQFEFSLLTALLVYLCARRWFAKAVALLPAAVFYCMPIMAVSATSAMVEMSVLFYGLLALFFGIQAAGRDNRREMVLAGALAGLAAATKMVGFFTVATLPLVVLAGTLASGRRAPRGVAGAGIVLGVAIATASPWFLRNWAWCGNPFFPELYRIFGGCHWNDYSHSVVSEIHRRYAGSMADRGLWGLLIAPWRLTNFADEGRTISSSVGPLCIALLPFTLYALKERSVAIMLFIFAIPCYIMWYYTAPYVDVHHLMPILPVLSLLGGAGLCYSPLWDRRLRPLVLGLLVMAWLHSLAVAAVFAAQFVPCLSGREALDDLLNRTTGYYQDMKWMNENLNRDDKVAMTVAHTYYLNIPNVPIAPYRQGWLDFSKAATPDELAERLSARGITHLYVVMNQVRPDMAAPHPSLEPYLRAMQGLLASHRVRRFYTNPRGVEGGRKPLWAGGKEACSETRVYEIVRRQTPHPGGGGR